MIQKNVLLVGSGGREHALAWRLLQSPRLGQLYVAPGNGGTAAIARNVPIAATDIEGLLDFVITQKIDLTIVGPDDPLALGIVDLFQGNNLPIFGPTQAAAKIEGSKVFSKNLMQKCGVPTSSFVVHTKHQEALSYVQAHFAEQQNCPLVIKASGLALGKGVYICPTLLEAEKALREIVLQRLHGNAGDEVVIEAFVEGNEVSLHALSDGYSYTLFPAAQDHKPVFDGDKGPNTGGMGTIAPVPWFTEVRTAGKLSVQPILAALQEQGTPFTGVLYPGLKLSEGGPVVLEYNARFGDPEAQVYLRLLQTDLLDVIAACVEGRLHELVLQWHPGFAACVVMASAGYPAPDYKRGLPISGIAEAEALPGVTVFQAGTTSNDGTLVTVGGRVLGVTAVGATLQEALDLAYAGVACIHFEGAHYRTDIGAKSL